LEINVRDRRVSFDTPSYRNYTEGVKFNYYFPIFMADENTTGANVGQPKPGGSASSIDPKLAGLLAWLLTPIASIIFMVMDDMKKDEFVQFHAKQSLYWFGVEVILWVIVGILGALTFGILGCVGLILPLVEMGVRVYAGVKAYNGEKVMLPIIGEMASK
jgi:uncharacterized membrane protein